MIEVSGLSKKYGDKTALEDVSFSVGEGEIVGLLGLNGAGKSTTMTSLPAISAQLPERCALRGWTYSSRRARCGRWWAICPNSRRCMAR